MRLIVGPSHSLLCRSLVGSSSGKAMSEQLQPLYELKNILQQNSQKLAGLEQRVKVRPLVTLYIHAPVISNSSLSTGSRKQLLISVLL